MKSIFIFGDTDYALLVGGYFERDSNYTLLGYTLDSEYLAGRESLEGYPILTFEELERRYLPEGTAVFSAIGYRKMRSRKIVYERIDQKGFELPNFVSDHAFVDPSAELGRNNIIMPGVVVEQNVSFGDNNIVWSNTTICHDTKIGSHNFFAANSTLGGGCIVGDLSFFGFSSTIMQGTALGDESLIAAMSYVNEDTRSMWQYRGIPAREYSCHIETGVEID